MVIISLKCLFLRETFVNLENGTKDGEFNHSRFLSVRKAKLFELNRKFLLQSLEAGVVYVSKFNSKSH